ncbi:MAG: carboxylesterase family protein [Ktedonobacteraceae bacterium]
MDSVVKTRYGEVRGEEIGGVTVFKGVPFAAPPFGANRFQPPRPVEPWSGVRDAFAYGPTVPKPPYPAPYHVLLLEPVIPGEDCLNLNIWSPELGAARRPVMVWIHGGAFVNGSGAVETYDGSRFARDGVVCVTINYRLGVDGFLYFGPDAGSANRGLLDQVAALEWVQENIAAFGGDPNNVTIFGESAGGMSVTTLLSMPRAKGLFRRVIAQSGAGQHVISADIGRKVCNHLAQKLGVAPTREAFAAVPLDRLLQAQAGVAGDVFSNPDPAIWGELLANQMPFEPVIDGAVIPARPIDGLMAGAGAGIDVLAGTNTEEQRLFLVPNGIIGHLTEQSLAGAIAGYGLPVEATLAAYRAARPEASVGDLYSAVVTDWFYRIPAIRLAEAQVKSSAKAYMYEFGWRSPSFDGALGACHALEIAFAFDTLNVPGQELLLGPNPPQSIADSMHAAWVAFATHGDPGWPQYDLKHRATMRFNTISELVDDPNSVERTQWEGFR